MAYNINDDIDNSLTTNNLDSSNLYKFLFESLKKILTTDNQVKTALTTYLQAQLATLSQNLNTPTLSQIENSFETKINSNSKISNINDKVNLITNSSSNNLGLTQKLDNILSKINDVPSLVTRVGEVSNVLYNGTGIDTLFQLNEDIRTKALLIMNDVYGSGPIQNKLISLENAITNFQPVVNIEGITISADDRDLLIGAIDTKITAAKNSIESNLLDSLDIETATSNIITPALENLYNNSLDSRFDSIDSQLVSTITKSDSLITKSDNISSKIGNASGNETVLSLLNSNSISLEQISSYCLGTWKIEDSYLKIYDASGQQVLFSFELKDENGNLNIFDIKQRVRAEQ